MKATAAVLFCICLLGASADAQQISAAPQPLQSVASASTHPSPDSLDWSGSSVSDGAGGVYVEDHSTWGDD